VFESCQNYIKDKKISLKLETLHIHVSYEYVCVSMFDTCRTRIQHYFDIADSNFICT